MNLVDVFVFLYFGTTLGAIPIFLFVPRLFKAHKVTIYEKENKGE